MQLLSFLGLFLTLFTATATANGKDRPCGKGWLFSDTEGYMWGDNMCHDTTANHKKVEVYKGCKCDFFSTVICGQTVQDRGGLVASIVAKNGNMAQSFTDEQQVKSYHCLR